MSTGRIVQTLDEIVDELEGVLCDPEGNVCIAGSEGDRVVIRGALNKLKGLGGRLEKEVRELGFDLVDDYFPKGKCKERGQAMVLYSLLVIRFLNKIRTELARGVLLNCPKCGKKLKCLRDPKTKKINRHLLGCKCLGTKRVSVG